MGKSDLNREKIRWACRRGMLELDLFLVPYFEKHFDSLDFQEKELFIELLSEIDPQLIHWLMAKEAPPSKFAALVDKIRHFRLSYKNLEIE